MEVLAPLISGVRNAEDGSAAVYRRGTTTLATLYSSIDGDTFGSSDLDANDRVILDAYGRATVYVDELVDVRVYDVDGTEQISFSAGTAPDAEEAEADEETLPYYVVTDSAYGAVGDGVADDTVAITAAMAAADAAGGGVVYFPEGSYRVTATLEPIQSVLMGATEETLLMIDHATDHLIAITSSITIKNLALGASQTNSGNAVSVSNGAVLTMQDCGLGLSDNSDGHLIGATDGCSLSLLNCGFRLGSGTASAIYTTGTLTARLTNCTFTTGTTPSYSGNGFVYGNGVRLSGCTFDVTSLTSGALACVKFNVGAGAAIGSVIDCVFDAPTSGSADVVGIYLGSASENTDFTESGNIFPVTQTQYTTPSFKAYDYSAHLAGKHLHLRSRDTRTILITDNVNATVIIPSDQYGTVILSTTRTSVSITGSRPPTGATGRLVVYHPSGGAGTATPGTNWYGASAATTADGGSYLWEYVCLTINAAARLHAIVDARTIGTPPTP